jgi:hypothetical protein
MENEQYIDGNKKALTILILFFVFWILLGITIKHYGDIRYEEVKQIDDPIIGMKELRSVHLWTVALPGTLLFSILTAFNFYLGIATLKQKQYPPNGISMPFKTKLLKGEKSKSCGYGYILSAFLWLIMAVLCPISWFIIQKIYYSALTSR